MQTNLAAELQNTRQHLRHIATLEQVDCLENACPWHSVRFTEVYKYLDVLHLNVRTQQLYVTNYFVRNCLPAVCMYDSCMMFIFTSEAV